MPKSKNRKGQKEKSRQRTLMIKRQDEKMRKGFFDMLQKAQQEAQEKSLQQAQTEQEKLVVDAPADLGLGEFQLTPESVPDQPSI